MPLKSIFLGFVLSVSIVLTIPVNADTQAEAVSEGVASALGSAMREIGLEISGGSLPAIEHMFSNWENLQNPCGNASRLIRAFMRDSNSNSLQSPTGIHFADVMMNTFDLPRSSAATLAAQGEIISSRLWGKYRLQRKLRDLLREIALLCNPPKPKPQVSLPAATGVAAGGGTGTGSQPPTPPQPPVQPPRPPVTPPAPAAPPEPDWSVDNPCPECQPIADSLKAEKARLKKLEAERAEENAKLGANQSEQAEITEEIATIKAVVEAQKGTGGSSFDPSTGTRISSVNVGGGKVVVTTTYADGTTVSYPRTTSSSRRAKKKIKKLEKKLKKLKEEEKKIKENVKKLDTRVNASKEKIKSLEKALEDCIREKCKKGRDPKSALLLPGGGTPTATGGKTACVPTLKHEAIAIGPKAEIGTGFHKAAEDVARKIVGGGLGGLFSGGGLTSGSSKENTAKPKKARDPIKSKHKDTFTIPGTSIKVQVGAMFDKEGNFLVSSKIKKAPGKGTFHDITAHNIDCQQMRPVKYYIYDLYRKWNISVQYTETTTTNYYQDGALVRTETNVEQSDWMDYASGKDYLGSGGVGYGAGITDNFPGIWRMSGFNRATSGNKGVGASFNLKYNNFSNPFVISLKYTQPDEDPVTAVPLNLLTCPQEDGKIELVNVKDYLAMKRHFDGGGEEEFDPYTSDQLVDKPADFQRKGLSGYRGQFPLLANRLMLRCPGYFDGKIPKWEIFEAADRKRQVLGEPDPNLAGDHFMEAFNNAFGAEWHPDDDLF